MPVLAPVVVGWLVQSRLGSTDAAAPLSTLMRSTCSAISSISGPSGPRGHMNNPPRSDSGWGSAISSA